MAPNTESSVGRVLSPKPHKRRAHAGRQPLPPLKPEPKGDDKAIEQHETDAQSITTLAGAFRNDLESIKNLVTCTICSQLLYEPYTLACGHTYCYSCLCNWFTSNRKKTCPDCRDPVKQMPANAYLIKQIVDTFVTRSELMPADESPAQHNTRRKEENDMVMADKDSQLGLFKGSFSNRPQRTLRYDEADGVLRCVECGHEYEGDPQCTVCHADFQGDEDEHITPPGLHGFDFSETDDMDDSDVDSELGYDLEDDMEEMDDAYPQLFIRGAVSRPTIPEWGHHRPRPSNYPLGYTSASELRRSRQLARHNPSDIEASDSEDEGSLADFIVADGNRSEPIEVGSTDGEEDSDEGGPIRASRRHRSRQARTTIRSLPARGSSETSTRNASVGFTHSGNWSPLQEDSEDDEDRRRREITENDSDAHTMIGNHHSDGSDNSDMDSEEPMSPATRRSIALHQAMRGQREQSVLSSVSGFSGYGYSAAEDESVVDGDGDVQMGASNLSRSSSLESVRDRQPSVEYLGSGRNVIDLDDDSSDGSVRPPIRRRRDLRNSHFSDRDQRIQRLFSQYVAGDSHRAARNQSLDHAVRRLDWSNPMIHGASSPGFLAPEPRYLPPRAQAHRFEGPTFGHRSSMVARFTPASERHGRSQRPSRPHFM